MAVGHTEVNALPGPLTRSTIGMTTWLIVAVAKAGAMAKDVRAILGRG